METSAATSFDINYQRTQAIATYDRVVREPDVHYHFQRGPDYARDFGRFFLGRKAQPEG